MGAGDGYRERVLDGELAERLSAIGAVLMKACGKTESAIRKAGGLPLSFAAKVDQGQAGPPAALGVITSTGFAYRRPDGVTVLPIGSLGP